MHHSSFAVHELQVYEAYKASPKDQDLMTLDYARVDKDGRFVVLADQVN